MRSTIALVAAAIITLGLSACPSNGDRMEVVPLENGSAGQAGAGGGGLPTGHIPVEGAQGASGSQAPNDAVHSGLGGAGAMPGLPAPPPAAIRFPATPDGWASVQPSSSMRLRQYKLPDPAKGGQDGEVVVFFFGGAAGGVQGNIDRWLNQWEIPGGKSAHAVAKQDTGKAGSWTVRFVEVDGTYVAPTMPGQASRQNQPGWTLLGAIVSAQNGNYFFKGTGPEKTMKHWREAFRTFVQGVRPR